MCGKSYVIPFFSKDFLKLSNFNSFTHTRLISNLEFIFCFIKLLGTQIFTSSQGIQVSFDELWRSNGTGGFGV